MRALAFVVSAVVAACGPQAQGPAASAQSAATAILLEMTPPCPRTAADAQREEQGSIRVFVEMVTLEADAARLETAKSVEALLSDPNAEIVSRHVLADSGVRTGLGGSRVTAHVAPGSSQVTLDVAFDAPAMRTTVTVGDGQRTVLSAAAQGERTRTTMIVPTIVRSDADLRRLYECRERGIAIRRK